MGKAMGDVIQAIPPTPKFDDRQAEEAGTLYSLNSVTKVGGG